MDSVSALYSQNDPSEEILEATSTTVPSNPESETTMFDRRQQQYRLTGSIGRRTAAIAIGGLRDHPAPRTPDPQSGAVAQQPVMETSTLAEPSTRSSPSRASNLTVATPSVTSATSAVTSTVTPSSSSGTGTGLAKRT